MLNMGNLLKQLLTTITNVIKLARPPHPEIPAPLLLCDVNNRPGLSAISLGTAIISRLPEIGIPNGVNADGSENLINKYTMLIAEELVNEIKKNGLAMNVIPAGSLNIQGTGMSTTGPVTFTGTNVSPTINKGGTL